MWGLEAHLEIFWWGLQPPFRCKLQCKAAAPLGEMLRKGPKRSKHPDLGALKHPFLKEFEVRLAMTPEGPWHLNIPNRPELQWFDLLWSAICYASYYAVKRSLRAENSGAFSITRLAWRKLQWTDWGGFVQKADIYVLGIVLVGKIMINHWILWHPNLRKPE